LCFFFFFFFFFLLVLVCFFFFVVLGFCVVLGGVGVRLWDAGDGGGGDGGGAGVLDYLLLNAAIAGGDVGAEERGGFAGWKEAVVVNHFGGFLFLFLFLAA
jgi:hypothetical protein